MQVQFSHDTKRYVDDKSQNFIVHLTCTDGSDKPLEVQDIGIEGDITSITHNTKDCISRIDDEVTYLRKHKLVEGHKNALNLTTWQKA